LFVLAVGVNAPPSREPLRLAEKDAQDFARVCHSQAGRFYSAVTITQLIGSEATQKRICDGLKPLENALDSDYVFIFFAGHGDVDDVTKQYYFAPATGDPPVARPRLLWRDQVRASLEWIRARVVLFLDTCRAGYADEATVDLLRGGREVGLITWAACEPDQFSRERPEWDNGAFTKAVTEALQGHLDPARPEAVEKGEISLDRAQVYTLRRVLKLTDGEQKPHVYSARGLPNDLPLAKIE
jgi:uncharacterized caspase-like protein